jgi:transcriptional regulator
MYIPEAFREARTEVLHDLIRQHSFATLVSQTEGGLVATHLPLLLDPARGQLGTLRGHVARANDHWRALAEAGEHLVVFQGPHAYISPAWYQTPMAVPTWNYVAVHAYGRPTLIDGGPALRQILDDTVALFESRLAYQWRPPEGDFIPTLMRNVVGFELELTRLEGKLKLSQNRARADQDGVVAALRAQGDPVGLGVADLMASLTG